jgi:replicative DNA helicase
MFDSEIAVIQQILEDPEFILEVELDEKDFLDINNRAVFSIIKDIQLEGGKPDAVSVLDRLSSPILYDHAISIIADGVSARSNRATYLEVVRREGLKAKLVTAGQEIARIGTEQGDFDPILERSIDLLSNLNKVDSKSTAHVSEALSEFLDDLDRRSNTDGIDGLSTGFEILDQRYQGLKKGELWILAARPAQGKSTLALNIAQHNAINNKSVLFFSLEMPKKQLSEKCVSSISMVGLNTLKAGSSDIEEYQWEMVANAMSSLKDSGLTIDDNGYQTIQSLMVTAKKHKAKKGLDLIVVDYLQLMTGQGQNRTEQIGGISRGLKLLAKELDVPVIALSQLNRSVESRPDKRPFMSDLRDSGSLEQDADMITFIYRDEYYYQNSALNKGFAEIITSKYRHGETGTDLLLTRLDCSKFSNITTAINYQPSQGE